MVLKRKRVRPLKDKPLGEGRTTRSKHPERKTTPEAKPESDDGWEAVKILAETKKRHLVSWAPGVERSGKIKIYKPSWVPKRGASAALLEDWEAEKKRTPSRNQNQEQQQEDLPSSIVAHSRKRALRRIIDDSPSPEDSSEADDEEPLPKRRRTDESPGKTSPSSVRVYISNPPWFNRDIYVNGDHSVSQQLAGPSQGPSQIHLVPVNGIQDIQIDNIPTPFPSTQRVIPHSQSLVETPSTVARVETQFAESGRTPVGVSDIVDLGSASAYEVNLVEDEPTSSEDGVQTPLTKTKSPPQTLTEVYEKSQSTTAGSQQQHLKLYEPRNPAPPPSGSIHTGTSNDHCGSELSEEDGIDLATEVAHHSTPHTPKIYSKDQSTSGSQAEQALVFSTGFETDAEQAERKPATQIDENQASQEAQAAELITSSETGFQQTEHELIIPLDENQVSQEAQALGETASFETSIRHIDYEPSTALDHSQAFSVHPSLRALVIHKDSGVALLDKDIAKAQERTASSPPETGLNSSAVLSQNECASALLPRSGGGDGDVQDPKTWLSNVSSHQLELSQSQGHLNYSGTTESALGSGRLPTVSTQVTPELVDNHSLPSVADAQFPVNGFVELSVVLVRAHDVSSPLAPALVKSLVATCEDVPSRPHAPFTTVSDQVVVESIEKYSELLASDIPPPLNTLPEHSASLLPEEDFSSSLAPAPSTVPDATPALLAPPRPQTPVTMSCNPQVTTPSTRGSIGPGKMSYLEKRQLRREIKNRSSPAARITNEEPANPGSASPLRTPTLASPLASPERLFSIISGHSLPAVVGLKSRSPDKPREVVHEDAAKTIDIAPMLPKSTGLPTVQNSATSSITSQSIFFLPLPLFSDAQQLFKQLLQHGRNLIKDFFDQSDPPQDSEVLEKVRELIEKLYNVTSHSDLIDDGTGTQHDETPELQANWSCKVSSKFIFLRDFFRAVSSSEVHIVIFAKPGRLLDMIETFMRGIGTSFSRPDQLRRYNDARNKLTSPLCVTLLPTGEQGARIIVERADLVVAFDETFNVRDAQVERVRTKILEVGQGCPVFSLIVANSMEHISRSLPMGLSDSERMRTLLIRATVVSESGGKLPAMPGFKLGQNVAHALLAETGQAWVFPSIDEMPLPDFDDQESISSSEPVRNFNILKRQSQQSTDEELHTMAKRPRFAPARNTVDPSSTSSVICVTDTNATNQSGTSRSEQQPSQELTALLEASIAREASLKTELVQAQTLANQSESILSALQTRFENQSQDLRGVQAELAMATNNLTATAARKIALSNTINELKAKHDTVRAELEDVRKSSLASPFPEIHVMAELRAKALSAEVLESKLASQTTDFNYMREQYQQASAIALEHASEIETLREENRVLKTEASGEKAKLRRLFEQDSLRMAHSELEKMRREKQCAEDAARKLAEEVWAFKERERKREKRSGMALNTRATSVPSDQVGLGLGVAPPARKGAPGPPGQMLTRMPARNGAGSKSRVGSTVVSRQVSPQRSTSARLMKD